jgi:2-keto-4-pentenoate hydratase
MTEEQQQRAADTLWELWRQERSIASLPDDIRPRTRQDGYAIQARIEGRSGAPLFGWKIAATSPAGQAHIAVDGPLAGRLLQERVGSSGDAMPVGRHPQMRVAEAEFAFRMSAALSPRPTPYSVPEVLQAVASLHPAIELPDSRFEDVTGVGAAQLIADNACASYFVLGPAAPESWRRTDLVEHRVTGSVNGQVQREGTGANVLGDPRAALAWLVNELSALRMTLAAGQVVTTGTCLVPLDVGPGHLVTMDFGTLGQVTARLR